MTASSTHDDRASRYTLSAFLLYRAAGGPEDAFNRPKLVERDAQRKTRPHGRSRSPPNRWLTRTLGEYPAADRDWRRDGW